MARQPFELLPGERLLLKSASVRNGFWSAYTDELTLTTIRLIHVNRGMFGNCKAVNIYNVCDISQAIVGKAQNGEKQLEVYVGGTMHDFAFQTRSSRELRIWPMAINDLMAGKANEVSFEYYQKFYSMKIDNNYSTQNSTNDYQAKNGINVDSRFVGDVAKNIIKSGNYSVKGIVKGVEKASKKQAKRGFFSEWGEALKEELGLDEIQDEFIEMGNELREEFGLQPKKTNAQIKEELFNAAVDRELNNHNNSNPSSFMNSASPEMTYDQRIEAVKKLKELMDSGIISQEEFDLKKKQLLGL